MDRQIAFRGNHPAKIDDRGRLKIPAEYKGQIEARFGPTPGVFITCEDDDGRCARIYPLDHWEEYEARIRQMPLSAEARIKLLDNVNFYGLTTQLDVQGRVQLPTALRETAELGADAEVYVMGQLECLAVWNQARWHEYRADRKTTAEDRKEREKFGL
jgi:MraZ protein